MTSPGAIACQIGPIVIRWYGILMATSIVVGLWLGYRQAKREGLPADDIVSVGQWAILAGLVGARLYEVVFNWDYYGRYPSKIIAVWEGGLAMHGGLIVGPLVGIWLAHRWNVPILRGLDIAAPSMVLGQAIGRWGNFFNEEAFGRPPDLPWKLYISPEHRPLGYAQFEYFHPTFLYESIRSEEHTSELQSHLNLVCRLLLEKKKKNKTHYRNERKKKTRETETA